MVPRAIQIPRPSRDLFASSGFARFMLCSVSDLPGRDLRTRGVPDRVREAYEPLLGVVVEDDFVEEILDGLLGPPDVGVQVVDRASPLRVNGEMTHGCANGDHVP